MEIDFCTSAEVGIFSEFFFLLSRISAEVYRIPYSKLRGIPRNDVEFREKYHTESGRKAGTTKHRHDHGHGHVHVHKNSIDTNIDLILDLDMTMDVGHGPGRKGGG